MMTPRRLTRRRVLGGLSAVASLALIGCGSREPAEPGPGAGQANGTTAAVHPARMLVYRDPSCGCCEAWAGIASNAGYQVELIDRSDMPAMKRQFGVPEELRSCHTAIVAGYAVEGHVPMEDVKRLLTEKPAGVRGIAVAGMPLGSPGMEVPDGTRQPFQVMTFNAAGRVSTFRAVGQREG